MFRSTICSAFCFLALASLGLASEPEIAIFPKEIQLTPFQTEQQISVRRRLEGGSFSEDLLRSQADQENVTLEIGNPAIAEWIRDEQGTHRLRAVCSGDTELVLVWKTANGLRQEVRASVRCVNIEKAATWEFGNHVQSILARNGCNMGACHGALAGKGGFRLSLRGYDAETDHFNITRQDLGRRIELSDPAMSLLLAKPSGKIEHRGGLRLPPDSKDYEILSQWIAAGATGPRLEDPKLESIEVLPGSTELKKGTSEQLVVQARYTNGRVEDVTRWAKFNSSDESIALVNEHGKVDIIGPGEGAVVAWFASRVALARIRVPFVESSQDRPALAAIQNQLGNANPIDDLAARQWYALGLAPSDRCSDAEFIRRSSLDATGTLPTPEQVETFLTDTAPDKRARWIEHLLASPEFVDYWTYRWSDMLMLNSNLLPAEGIRAYYSWIRQHVERNTRWDAMVREILTARGESLENGATNFYAINQDPESMTENACQAFLALSIGCAKCHNHPLEKWTNDQYYAMANLFARVRAKGWGGEVRDGGPARTLYVADRGDLIQPLRGKPQPPAPLDAPPIDIHSPMDRRIVLADWMTSPNNPYVTRAIVNRVWAAYFGIGLVNPVDDLRASNPASNPALMDYLCRYLIEQEYDLKTLMRHIMNSETYQRSSRPIPGNADETKYFTRYYPKRLMAEVIHDAIATVTGVPTEFTKVSFLGGDKRDTKFYPKGTRALQLFDSSVENSFLKTFGRNQRRITCECERSDEPSVIQVLNLSNGDTLNNKLVSSESIVERWLETYKEDPSGLVRAATLRTLSRFPTDAETARLIEELRAPDSDRRVVLEDLLWSLMSSKEFLFNH
ncbi:MAG: DUF1553 domain-containing protein [Planctomycetota bacterium]